MSNVDKRKLNKHIRKTDELYSEFRAMERSLYAAGMKKESAIYRDISNHVSYVSLKLKEL